jgi:hypothetical protein
MYPFATQFNKNKYSFSHLKNDYDPKPLPMDELERLLMDYGIMESEETAA